MNTRKEAIQLQIELLRQNMYEVVNLHGIRSPQALIASQYVDYTLNKYNRLQITLKEIAS